LSDTEPSMIERIAASVQMHANAKQVYGEPIERGATTIIPVARVQWGFGAGRLGRGGREGGGGGGGVRAYPSGFIELHDDRAEFRAIHDARSSSILGGIALGGIVAGLLLGKLLRR
jgi:uncharacterized spore protein YtfJ